MSDPQLSNPVDEAADSHWSHTLHSCGRRVTKQRLAIIHAAHAHPHSTAEELHVLAQEALPALALPTVHLIVGDLTKIGLLRRIDLPHSPARYEANRGDNHHHVQCICCGRIEDVACAVGHAPCLTPENSHGMQILMVEVLYKGICPDCAADLPDGHLMAIDPL